MCVCISEREGEREREGEKREREDRENMWEIAVERQRQTYFLTLGPMAHETPAPRSRGQNHRLKIQKYQKHRVYTNCFRKVRANFRPLSCDMSHEPSRNCSDRYTCSDKLVYFGWIFLLRH